MRSLVKSYWVKPQPEEVGAPATRILHGKYFAFEREQRGLRIGFGEGIGYFKCGSDAEAPDWVEDYEIHAWLNGGWQLVARERGLGRPQAPHWVEMPPARLYFVTVRRSGVDGWWPCYNVAETAIYLEGVIEGQPRRAVRNLHRVIGAPDAGALAAEGITVRRSSARIEYETPYYRIGFKLKSPGLYLLAGDGEGAGKTQLNLLDATSIMNAGDDAYRVQGLVVQACDDPTGGTGFLQYDCEGETQLTGNELCYRLAHAATGQQLELRFRMRRDKVEFAGLRRAERDVELLDSAALRLAFRSTAAPLTALGEVLREGETGRLATPLTLHLPGQVSIRVEGEAVCRYNSIRKEFLNNFDLQVGEEPAAHGGTLVRAGEHRAAATLSFGGGNHVPLAADAPAPVRRALDLYLLSGLPFRADTATFSNNGNSMSAPICLDTWADICAAVGNGPCGVETLYFLRSTLEMHLMGVPAYATGLHSSGDHLYEDEYLMTGAAVLYGIGKYLNLAGTPEWFAAFRGPIEERIARMRERVPDDDGLIASRIRRGVSGEHQWSTVWYDVISYGYKDAMSNAILYGALRELAAALDRFAGAGGAQLRAWAERIKAAYTPTFLTERGWLAGWRDAKGQLHDYGFLAVNGMAAELGLLEPAAAHRAIAGLYRALLDSGFDGFDMGLPGNVFDIGNEDTAAPQHHLPFGGYQNAGITLSQSRHFLNGLYAVGMDREADAILEAMAQGLAEGLTVGGVASGVDWKTWDGTPSGYEGNLCDQFGVLQPLLRRYREE